VGQRLLTCSRVVRVVVFGGSLLSAWARIGLAGPIDGDEAAVALVGRALAVVDLDHPARAFSQSGTVELAGPDGASEGIYLLICAPGGWRQEVGIGGWVEVRGSTAAIRWRQAPPSKPPSRWSELRLLLGYRERLAALLANPSVLGVPTRKHLGGRDLSCVVRDDGGLNRATYCFDHSTGAMVREEIGETVIELSPPGGGSGSALPATLQLSRRKRVEAAIRTRPAVLANSFPTHLFAPHRDAEQWPVCTPDAVRVLLRREDPQISPARLRALADRRATLLGEVGADGIPRDLVVVESGGLGTDDAILSAVGHWLYQPATCSGRPVAEAFTVTIGFSFETDGFSFQDIFPPCPCQKRNNP
jgi:hypothetical protein